jgi:hypothetical protein
VWIPIIDLPRDHIFGAHDMKLVALLSPFAAVASLSIATTTTHQWLISSDVRGKMKVGLHRSLLVPGQAAG